MAQGGADRLSGARRGLQRAYSRAKALPQALLETFREHPQLVPLVIALLLLADFALIFPR